MNCIMPTIIHLVKLRVSIVSVDKRFTIISDGPKKILQQYEDKLNLYHSFIDRNNKLDQIQTYVGKKYPHDEKLNSMIKNLETTEEQ